MRAVFGLVLVVGLGLAGFAVYMAKNYVTAQQGELARVRAANAEIVRTVDVYVATRTLKYGETLKPEDVRIAKWPERTQPEGVFRTKEDLFPNDGEKLRTVLRAIEKNEVLMAIKVTKPGESAGLTSLLERGMRAFAIKVDVASGVSGFLRPGDHVDVYWTGKVTTNERKGEVSKLIETRVKLIAIDQTANYDSTETSIARTVTVAATPAQVAALALAQSTGKLSLSLVGAEDDTVAEAIEVDQRSLLGLASAPIAIQEQERKICTIRTRRGAEVVEIPIPCTN